MIGIQFGGPKTGPDNLIGWIEACHSILEAARRWLGADECREISAAMARRRGIGTSGSAVFIYPST